MTTYNVSSGQTVSNFALSSTDIMNIAAGGFAVNITDSGGAINDSGSLISSLIIAGGSDTIFSGGVASETVVNDGGFQVVSSGGVAIETSVNFQGEEIINPGGVASRTVLSGGFQVMGGGIASGTVVYSGSFQDVGGGVASDTVVSFGGEQVVAFGGVAFGTAVGTVVYSGGYQGVGGVVSDTVVSFGGEQDVVDGGLANGTVVSGGTEVVLAGGVASGTVVSVGGHETVSSLGLAIGTVVGSGGMEIVSSGGVASGTMDVGGEVVSAGGVASGTVVSSGGKEIASSGGVVRGTVVSSGGFENVGSGGVASDTMVSFDGTETVFSGGLAIGTTVSSGGLQDVFGVVSDTVVSTFGEERVLSAGLASATVVNGGVEIVFSGGVASGTLVNSGADAVSAGGIAIGTTVNSGAEVVYSGGMTSGSVFFGGAENVFSGGVASNSVVFSGTVVEDDGTLLYHNNSGSMFFSSMFFNGILSGSGVLAKTGSGTLVLSGDESAFSGIIGISGGIVELASGTAAGSASLLFGGASELRIDGTTMPANTISGFVSGDTINLANIPFASGDSATYNSSTHTLSIQSGGTVLVSLSLVGEPYTTSNFALSQDPVNSGIDITTDLPCFAAGTRILTERGAVAVEELRPGDRVRTAAGALQPIVWIGTRRVDCRRHPEPEIVWPIRVQAGAFADGLPERDLWLSPDHAVFAEDVLIPVKYLRNGASITQECVEAVEYFHIELPRHDILLAEGLPVESYLDTGNRAQFANGGAVMTLVADFAETAGGWDWEKACAPLQTEGEPVTALRQRLLERLPKLGYRRETAPDLHLLIEGRTLRPLMIRGPLYQFSLPPGCTAVRICSRAGVPAGHDLAVTDCRWLGVRIAGALLAGRLLPLEGPAFAEGFYPLEQDAEARWRWTDGAALLVLPVPPERHAILELFVPETMPAWQLPLPSPRLTQAA